MDQPIDLLWSPQSDPPLNSGYDLDEIAAPPATQPAPAAVFPGLTLDLGHRRIDLDATVVGREVEWLELLACSPGTREHESIVTLDASATDLQAALLLLGLEPGSPMTVERDGDAIVVHPPTGPQVEVFFLIDGDQPVPANRWVVAQDTGEVMPDHRWLFTGSRFTEFNGQRWFLAEQNGTLISLVSFGDDLLGRPTTQSDQGGNGLWTANTDAIPPLGTRLTVRLQPVAPPADDRPAATATAPASPE